MLKVCCTCKEEKEYSSFYKNRSKPDGHTYQCKECIKQTRNLEINKKNCSKYYYRNKNRWIKYREENRSKLNSIQAKYRSSKLNATPKWLTEYDWEMINWTYEAAKIAEKHYGTSFHVDHIVPFQGKDICGLHVPWNLQVITAHDNMSKGNKMPEEGLDPSQM